MKGLDLFLVLLILLSWRRCFTSQEVTPDFRHQLVCIPLLHFAFAAAFVDSTTASSPSRVQAPASIDRDEQYQYHQPHHQHHQEEFPSTRNISNSTRSKITTATTTASSPSEITSLNERLLSLERKWNEEAEQRQQLPRGNDLASDHYLFSPKHNNGLDFDFKGKDDVEDDDDGDSDDDENGKDVFDKDDFTVDGEENKKDENENAAFPLPSWIEPPQLLLASQEATRRRRILEHRSLKRYLRQHHKQHIKRRRLIEQQERLMKQEEEEEEKEEPSSSDVGVVEEKGDSSAASVTTSRHYYNDHDPLWKRGKKRRGHGQHGRRDWREELRVGENHRDNNSHPEKSQDGSMVEKDQDAERVVTTPKLTDKKNSAAHLASNKVFRHSNRFLDKFYMDTQQGFLDADNLNSLDLNVSTISELIWKLRGMRSRRRRSFQGMNANQTRMNSGSASTVAGSAGVKGVHFDGGGNSNTIDPQKLIISNVTWPLKRIAEIEGDLWLGGLMMVHEREDNITCGPIMPQGGVQSLEAMLYTIDWINREEVIPGVKIGAYILDDCDKDTYGLEQAVDFIKGSISNIDDVDIAATCSDGDFPGARKHHVIAGVVGAASSVTSIQVANLLRLFKIPQVSYFSTSPELSNKQRFEYFSRTIPSDKHQVKAMVEIVKKFGWQYVSIIYEESNYGIKAFEELERLLPENDICIAAKEKLVKDSGVAGEDSYERIVDKLVAGKAKGVIIYGSDQEVKELMRAVRKRNETGSFAWIGSDGWSARTLVSDGNEREVEGTLSVQPKANPVKGFDEYFLNLNVRNNTRNPWFIEFWEHHWQCKYPNSSRTPYNLGYEKLCTGYEKLTMENTVFEAQLQYVSDAVLAFAFALRDMHKRKCAGKAGLCSKMNPVDGTELLEDLKKTQFKGLSDDHFHFDEFGDGPARYNIIHFRRREGSGTYHWTRVGEYNEGVLSLNMSGVQFADGSSTPPVSICSKPCDVGEATRYVGGDKCCWSCLKCVNDQIRNPVDEQECSVCPYGTLPNSEHTVCVPIKEEYLRYSDGWAIGAMTFAGVGCVLTAAVVGVYMVHNDTPVVRASGRELSYVILIGLFFCYALTFLFIIRPNDWICGVQQFMTGFVFTVVYAALLTKTNRIARIFEAGKKSARRPSFISPRSQLVICTMMVSIQVLINVVWMLLQPPKAKYYYPTRQDNFLVCEAYINHSYAIAFWYPLLIICVCTIYAVLTRKIPEAFNESKYIGFTMYTTCIIWLAFVPIYFSTGTQVALRVTSMTVAISLSAYVMIACLFGPKLYIIIFHPERNIRQSMMAPAARYSTIASAAAPGTVPGGPASLNASALGGSGAITPIQMSAIKHNHFENSSVKGNLTTHSHQLPQPIKVDCGTQYDHESNEGQVEKTKVSSDACNSKSSDYENEKSSSRAPQTATISTQTEDSYCIRSTNTTAASGKIGASNSVTLNNGNPGISASPGGQRSDKDQDGDGKPHKLCNHDHSDRNDVIDNMAAECVLKPSQTPSAAMDAASATSLTHHHHHHHHQPQPQRPQRISFRKEGQPPTTQNQQNKSGSGASNRSNTVVGDTNKVTIIVAKDSGDVLL